ncbi:MAG: exodeoxyribonuclease VII small subunit [Nitrospinae bacterium]|nr:exodeoxyribonuclease VII small subunit [Nitrospinota bacterium]
MEQPTFEGALQRLEEIVAHLERNELDLEQSLQLFEEGVTLVRFCTTRLDEAERRIEVLLADKEGRVHAEPFPEEPVDQGNE